MRHLARVLDEPVVLQVFGSVSSARSTVVVPLQELHVFSEGLQRLLEQRSGSLGCWQLLRLASSSSRYALALLLYVRFFTDQPLWKSPVAELDAHRVYRSESQLREVVFAHGNPIEAMKAPPRGRLWCSLAFRARSSHLGCRR